MNPPVSGEIAASLAKRAYDANNNLIIKTFEKIHDILYSRYNSRPDSQDQYDDNGPYHFNNLDIQKIYDIYDSIMKKYPETRPHVRVGRRLTYQEQASPEQHPISRRLNNIFNDMNIEGQLPEF